MSRAPDSFKWRGETFEVRSAFPEDVAAIVRFRREIVAARPASGNEEDPDAWFRLGGPWMHPTYFALRLRLYADLGFDAWLVCSGAADVVGNVELW